MKENGISDADMAQKLECSAGAVWKWCVGERMPEPKFVERIVEVTGGSVSISDLHETRMAYLKGEAA